MPDDTSYLVCYRISIKAFVVRCRFLKKGRKMNYLVKLLIARIRYLAIR